MERHIRDALEEEVIYDHAQFGLLNDHSDRDAFVTSHLNGKESKLWFYLSGKWSCLTRTFALCAAYLSLGLCIAITGPTLHYLEKQVGASVSEMGCIFSGRSLGLLLSSFIGGYTLDRFNRYLVLFLVMAFVAISAAVTPWCRQLWMLTASASVIGMSGGFLDTGSGIICTDLWGQDSGRYTQALHISFALGGVLAPLLVQSVIGDALVISAEHSRHVRQADSANKIVAATESIRLTAHLNETAPPPTDFTKLSVSDVPQAVVSEEPDHIDSKVLMGLMGNSSDIQKNGSQAVVGEMTTTTAKPARRPKPDHIDGKVLGDSSDFEKIPLSNQQPEQDPTTIQSTTSTTVSTTTAITTTTLATTTTTAPPTTTTTLAPTTTTTTTTLASTTTTTTTTTPVPTTTTTTPTTTTPAQTTTTTPDPTTTTTTPAPTTTTTTPAPITTTTNPVPSTSTTTPALTMTTTTAAPTTTSSPSTTMAVAVPTKSRGKSRGQQDDQTTQRSNMTDTASNHASQMHSVYTISAIVALHVAFFFLFFLCSPGRPSSPAPTKNLRPTRLRSTITLTIFFLFYSLFTGSQVAYSQLLTHFAISNQISTSNYLVCIFWSSLAVTQLATTLFSSQNPVIILTTNLILCSAGAVMLSTAGASQPIIYLATAMLGTGMASTSDPAKLWTGHRIQLNGRSGARFGVGASVAGQLVVPAVMASYSGVDPEMALPYAMLLTNIGCVLLFISAWLLSRSRSNEANNDYQLALQADDD